MLSTISLNIKELTIVSLLESLRFKSMEFELTIYREATLIKKYSKFSNYIKFKMCVKISLKIKRQTIL